MITLAKFYLLIVFVFWMLSAFACGFAVKRPKAEDFYDSILWPISIATLLGNVTRVVVEKIKQKPKKETNNDSTK